MSFHAGQSFTFGETPSATKWNYLWENDYALANGTGISAGVITSTHLANDSVPPTKWTNPNCFRAYASGSTTLTDGAFVKILTATENYDYNNNFASSTYTAAVSGPHHFVGAVTYATAAATPVQALCLFYVNGVAAAQGGNYLGITGGAPVYQISSPLLLTAGDTVDLYHYQDSAGNEATATGSDKTYFAGQLIHSL